METFVLLVIQALILHGEGLICVLVRLGEESVTHHGLRLKPLLFVGKKDFLLMASAFLIHSLSYFFMHSCYNLCYISQVRLLYLLELELL